MFKKKPLDLKPIEETKTKKNKKIYTIIFWLIAILIISSIWIVSFASLSLLDLNSIFSNQIDFKIEKQDTDSSKNISRNKINILLLWKGWDGHDAPDLTDTIILASINTKYKTISMLSIPRDLYVVYEWQKTWKINWIYAREMSINKKDERKSVSALTDKITEITWENIDYYVSIDFKWFSAFVDAIWWINITVDKKIVDNSYPDYRWWYQTFIIKEWTWKFDWETALKYARSRHSTSDFDRNLRQQQIISSIKDKLSEWWFFAKISKIRSFYDVFTKYVKTDISWMETISLYTEVWDYSKYKVLSFNLNNTCFYGDSACETWWFLYTPDRNSFWWASVVLVDGSTVSKLSNYEALVPFMNLIFNYPIVFKEDKQINIYNASKFSWIANELAVELKRNWFNIPEKKSLHTIKNASFSWSFISYEKWNEKSKTLKILEDVLKLDSKQNFSGSLVEVIDENTQIEIILWDDYKTVLENLSNNL